MLCKIAILASGNGSNFEALVRTAKNYQVQVLICDHKDAYVIERAKQLGIPHRIILKTIEGEKFEEKIVTTLKEFAVELVVLAGFMKIVGKEMLNNFPQRIINIHPSLLPLYPGMHSIQQAYENKNSKTGISIHYVDAGIDTGEMIAQYDLSIDPLWSLQELETHVHHLEHHRFPEVINKIAKEKKWEKL